MTNKKIKIPVILLGVDILAIALMYGIGAYMDLSQNCTGLMGASAPCVEEYFYGYLYLAYIFGFALIGFIVINWVSIGIRTKKPKKK